MSRVAPGHPDGQVHGDFRGAEPPARAVTLCADDYGLAPGVSQAILALAAQERLSATSCITVYPDWPEHAALLKPLRETLEVGLHMVLTDAPPLTPMPKTAPEGYLPSLARLLLDAQLGRLVQAEITAEVRQQLDAFEAAFGDLPNFVDGHRHVHVLPGIREAIGDLFIEGRLDRHKTWLRVCTAPWTVLRRCREALPQALLIDRLARPAAMLANGLGIRANRRFLGVNGFRPGGVAHRFGRWLDHVVPDTVIMCHPGYVDAGLIGRDAVHAAREAERAYLSGPDFADALAVRGLTLGPLGMTGPSSSNPLNAQHEPTALG